MKNILEEIVQTGKDLLKPHEYQILVISWGIWIAIEQILNQAGVDVKDIPSESLSGPILYSSLIASILPLFHFSTGKLGDFSSRANVNQQVLSLTQNGDILRGTCNMMYDSARESGLFGNKKEQTEEHKKIQEQADTLRKKLKYTYLASVLLSSYILRGEEWPCFKSFECVCENWNDWKCDIEQTLTKEELKREKESWYIDIFTQAIQDAENTAGFNEKISARNISFIVEVINQIEDDYNEIFVEFASVIGKPVKTLEEALAISELSVKPEETTLRFLKEKARGRKGLFYTLLALSMISMNRADELQNITWLNSTYLKEAIEFLSSHTNAIVGTTISFIALRALGTINSNNALSAYLGRRLIPTISRIEIEKSLD